MLDRAQQDEIGTAVLRVCDVFRGVSAPGDSIHFTLAMLLLKYVSDNGQDSGRPGQARPDAGQWVVPDGADFFALHALRLEPDNGWRIDQALRALEEANAPLRGAFQGISFNATALGSAEQKEHVLRQLLETFNVAALNFCTELTDSAEAVAYACDLLIRYAAESRGKWGEEFLTPSEISQLIARLMEPKGGETICDPFCGSGSLLIACSKQAHQSLGGKDCSLYGQEKNGGTWALAKMNMILHSESRCQLEWGDTLRAPKLLSADGSLEKFEIVVSSPPISLRDWGAEEAAQDVYQRYWRGVPRASGDYAVISHMLETLKPEVGRMAVVVSHGVLFRGGVEGKIRERLIEENSIDAVIALPVKMLYHVGIPVALLVMRKNKADDGVLFIDASRDYQYGKTQNVLRVSDLERIESTYRARENVPQYSRLVARTEIASYDYNLNVARYVEQSEEEERIDLTALRAERARLNAELASLEAKLAILLQEIGHA
ncbi:N-6 DNA methylase [Paraburkholderia sediminicola]|uniref:N-6 DNA methylase n=1 Tax=Paraburkholderia sediminicola TaxID=458836 RepID=UPI0038BA5C9C